jgi:hypothetical protein
MPLLTVLLFEKDPVDFTKNTFPPPGPVSPTTHVPPSAQVRDADAAGVKNTTEANENTATVNMLLIFM